MAGDLLTDGQNPPPPLGLLGLSREELHSLYANTGRKKQSFCLYDYDNDKKQDTKSVLETRYKVDLLIYNLNTV